MPNLGNYQEPVPFNQAPAHSPSGNSLPRPASWAATSAIVSSSVVVRVSRGRALTPSSSTAGTGFAQETRGDSKPPSGAAVQAIEQLARLATEEERRRAAVRAGIQQWHAACLQADAIPAAAALAEATTGGHRPIEPPRIPSIDCPPTPRLAAASTGGGMTGRSSADPDLLDRFVAESRAQDKFMEGRLRVLERACNAFLSSSRNWGNFDVSPLIASLRTSPGLQRGRRQLDVDGLSDIPERRLRRRRGLVRRRDETDGGDHDSDDEGAGPADQHGNAAGNSRHFRRNHVCVATLPVSISRVDDRPVDQYLRDIGRQRSAQSQGTSSVVTAVAMNRRTGEVVEGKPT